MQVACSRCKTKYNVPAEKLQGQLLKVRCKKCGHVFGVRKKEPPKVSEEELSAVATAVDVGVAQDSGLGDELGRSPGAEDSFADDVTPPETPEDESLEEEAIGEAADQVSEASHVADGQDAEEEPEEDASGLDLSDLELDVFNEDAEDAGELYSSDDDDDGEGIEGIEGAATADDDEVDPLGISLDDSFEPESEHEVDGFSLDDSFAPQEEEALEEPLPERFDIPEDSADEAEPLSTGPVSEQAMGEDEAAGAEEAEDEGLSLSGLTLGAYNTEATFGIGAGDTDEVTDGLGDSITEGPGPSIEGQLEDAFNAGAPSGSASQDQGFSSFGMPGGDYDDADQVSVDDLIQPELPGSGKEGPHLDLRKGSRRDKQASTDPVARQQSKGRTMRAIFIAVICGAVAFTVYNLILQPDTAFYLMTPDSLSELSERQQIQKQLTLLEPVEAAYIERADKEPLYIISGFVRNSTPSPVSSIKVKGTIFSDTGAELGTAEAYAGNVLEPAALTTLPVKAIAGESQKAAGVGPERAELSTGDKVGYMIVFTEAPEGIKSYRVDVVSSGQAPETGK